MFKNVFIIGVGFAGSFTLWGCSSEDTPQQDLIDVMETAVSAYYNAKNKEIVLLN